MEGEGSGGSVWGVEVLTEAVVELGRRGNSQGVSGLKGGMGAAVEESIDGGGGAAVDEEGTTTSPWLPPLPLVSSLVMMATTATMMRKVTMPMAMPMMYRRRVGSAHQDLTVARELSRWEVERSSMRESSRSRASE